MTPFQPQPQASMPPPMTPDGRVTIMRRGGVSPLADPYHLLLSMSWPVFFMVTVGLFFVVNCIFAELYLLGGPCLSNTRPGEFRDAFYFSVQTIGTVGYGVMAPTTDYAHTVVCIEVLAGILGFALITGLVFARFARPTARILFSKVAVIAPHNGIPTLMFRMANQRGSHILEAQIRLTVLLNETTQEGDTLRRFFDLPLVRNQSPVFGLSWLALHPITPDSPIAHLTPDNISADNLILLVTLVGIDETLVNNVHARHAYFPEMIIWQHRFVDVFVQNRQGQYCLDFRRFHQTYPIAAASP